MATLTITDWKDPHVGWTGWDSHARSELRKRLRKGINMPPQELKGMCRDILGRKTLALAGIDKGSVESVRQILETMGAVVELSQ
jgi:hypothetical protein